MSPLFCRHNRYLAECPICAKGTVFDKTAAKRPAAPRAARRSSGRRPSAPPPGAARVTVGPFAQAGPYERGDGSRYEVRLERVPGGIRLGGWRGRELERRAPVLAAADLPALVAQVAARELLVEVDARRLVDALAVAPAAERGPYGVSPGRSGDFREELRVEPVEEPGLVRVDPVEEPELVRLARWVYRPGPAEWELQDAAPMLPVARFAEALASAVRSGVLTPT